MPNKRIKRLTLLHSNDLHGDFLPEEIDGTAVGGVSLLSGYVTRATEENPDTLYVIAGDMFRGSVIDAEYRGISTVEIVNMLAPDAVCVGNHETDYGVAHLLFLEKCARFPILCANLHVTTNGARLFSPCRVVKIGGMKVLFIGILTEEVLAQTRSEKLIGAFIDVGEAAKEVGRITGAYRAADIDLTVLLTHLGLDADRELAARLDPAWGVDLILGGHSHTFMKEPETVNGIPIAQAGFGSKQIGRFDLRVDTAENRLASWEWRLDPVNERTASRDPAVEEQIRRFKSVTDQKYNRVVTRLRKRLTHPARNRETELGDLLAECVRDAMDLDVMLFASGGIRTSALGPVVTYSDLTECFPFNDALFMAKVTGEQLRRMFVYMLRDEALDGGHTEFYQISDGLRVVYDRAKKEAVSLTFDGDEVENREILTVGLAEYHMRNLETCLGIRPEELERNGKIRLIAASIQDLLDEYLTANPHLGHPADGRISVIGGE